MDNYESKNVFGCKLILMVQDIVDARTYDKMRPPRPGGTPSILTFINLYILLTCVTFPKRKFGRMC